MTEPIGDLIGSQMNQFNKRTECRKNDIHKIIGIDFKTT